MINKINMTGTALKSMILVLSMLLWSCTKMEESYTKVKAPLRNYTITARLDNKQAGTSSKATGILKGSYSETTKILSYTLTYESIAPKSVRIDKGFLGAFGPSIAELPKNDGQKYKSPMKAERKLTSLEERDMLKGLWFISMESSNYKPWEIRGIVTIKQN